MLKGHFLVIIFHVHFLEKWSFFGHYWVKIWSFFGHFLLVNLVIILRLRLSVTEHSEVVTQSTRVKYSQNTEHIQS